MNLEFLATFQFSWLARNLTLMNILTSRGYAQGEWAHSGRDWGLCFWDVEGFRGGCHTLNGGPCLLREGQPWGCVFSEQVYFVPEVIWNLLVGSFNYFYSNNFCAQNLLKLNETTHTVSHKFWYCIIHSSWTQGGTWKSLEATWKPEARILVQVLSFHHCESLRDLLVSTMKVLTFYYNLFWGSVSITHYPVCIFFMFYLNA